MIVEGAEAGRVFPVTGDTIVIGRGADCGVMLPDVGVSRRHARVRVRAHDFLLEDLQSKNGTFVEGVAVSSRSLAVGDVFHVGPNVRIRLAMMEQTEERLARQLRRARARMGNLECTKADSTELCKQVHCAGVDNQPPLSAWPSCCRPTDMLLCDLRHQ
jgi:predicted component of type VI protein secretion system